jgi:hypothetical protein
MKYLWLSSIKTLLSYKIHCILINGRYFDLSGILELKEKFVYFVYVNMLQNLALEYQPRFSNNHTGYYVALTTIPAGAFLFQLCFILNRNVKQTFELKGLQQKPSEEKQ